MNAALISVLSKFQQDGGKISRFGIGMTATKAAERLEAGKPVTLTRTAVSNYRETIWVDGQGRYDCLPSSNGAHQEVVTRTAYTKSKIKAGSVPELVAQLGIDTLDIKR